MVTGQNLFTKPFLVLVMGRTMFEVRCSIVRSQKWGVRVQLLKDEKVWVPSMFEQMMFESVQWII